MSGEYCKGMTKKEYHRAYYLANREAMLAKAKADYAADPKKREKARKEASARWEKLNPSRRSAMRKGIDPDTVPQRPDTCDVCRLPAQGKHMHLDHDHATGLFRGWLCRNCNLALGFVGDSTETLDRLKTYLSR